MTIVNYIGCNFKLPLSDENSKDEILVSEIDSKKDKK